VSPNGMTRAERDALLARCRAAEERRLELARADEPDYEEMRRLDALAAGLREEYAWRLPRVPFARCPHCGAVLSRSLDPWGLDGPWWNALGLVQPQEPPACEHFCVVLGALNLMGRAPREVEDDVEPGPEVPFVVPRLLGLSGMRAVVNGIALETGDRAFVIAYFADPLPPMDQWHQPWGRRSYTVRDEDGAPQGFAIMNDPWDFDLARWAESGALQWIAPGDTALALRGRADGPCPYAGLPGERRPQLLRNGQRILLDPPDGAAVDLGD